MFRIVFCDDNSQYLVALKATVQKECEKIIPTGEEVLVGPGFGSGEALLEYIKENHVDALLLDIDMPTLNGFEIARILSTEYPMIKIIFMSAYDNFVYSSFEYYPFAYLRKSHMSDELPKVLKRMVDKMNEAERQLVLTTTLGMKKVDVNSILYVESERNYYSVYLVHGKKYICRGPLSDFEKEISGFDFFRIHSAFIVNLEHVDRILENGFVLIKSTTLPIAQKRAPAFKKTYMEYVRRCFNT